MTQFSYQGQSDMISGMSSLSSNKENYRPIPALKIILNIPLDIHLKSKMNFPKSHTT